MARTFRLIKGASYIVPGLVVQNGEVVSVTDESRADLLASSRCFEEIKSSKSEKSEEAPAKKEEAHAAPAKSHGHGKK